MPAMPTPAEGVLAIPAALYTPEPPVETLPGGAGLVARRVKATTPAAIKHQAQREQPVAAVQSKRAAGPQWWRMLFHVVGMCTAAILCLVIEDPYWRGGLCIFALVLAVLYELGRKSRNNWFGRLCNRPIVREHEVDTRAASTDFGIAMAVMAMFFQPTVAAIAFLVAALADPMARLWGMRFGRRRWFGSKKTVEGSLACFAVAATVILMASSSLSVAAGLGVAAIAMAAELIPQTAINTRFGKLLTPCDNFYVPLLTGAVMQVLI